MADGVSKREGGEFLREALTRRTARPREHGKRKLRLNQARSDQDYRSSKAGIREKKKRTDNAIDCDHCCDRDSYMDVAGVILCDNFP